MATFAARFVGALKLDDRVYEEVEADRTALPQSAAVVLLSSLAAGIGMGQYVGAAGIVYGMVGAILGWLVWAVLAWAVGTRLLPEPQTRADLGELLRTLGFASAPGVLQVFAFVPRLGWIFLLVVSIWMVMAMVVAVRSALDYRSLPRAVAVVLIGWIVHLVVRALLMPVYRLE